jgi:D-glycero-D-manno-heptose 1,7-bisphosphate phosphatase
LKKNATGWTLFLDRDGVINERLPGDYVKTWEEFKFLPGVLPAIAGFSKIFSKICIVTNQAGVGKGLMNSEDLHLIHKKMKKVIRKHKGRIDKIYACTSTAETIPNCRKPNPWMGHMAKIDFPHVDFQRSIIMGDSHSDIEFGKALGMKTLEIHTESNIPQHQADFSAPNLWSAYQLIRTLIRFT